jgi:hypothetical protein
VIYGVWYLGQHEQYEETYYSRHKCQTDLVPHAESVPETEEIHDRVSVPLSLVRKGQASLAGRDVQINPLPLQYQELPVGLTLHAK